jgi:hypothetical protein
MALDDAQWRRWHALAETPDPDTPHAPAGGRDPGRATRVRTLDAAAELVGAARNLLAIVEEDLRDRRDHLAGGAADRAEPGPPPDPTVRRGRIDLTY